MTIEAMKQALEAYELDQSTENHGTLMHAVHDHIAEAAVAEQHKKQEPYGYVWTSLKDCMETRFSRMYPANFYSPMDVIAVYTHPQPKREPLTDEQIDDLARTMVKGNKSVNWLARAIEAKLKEKNT